MQTPDERKALIAAGRFEQLEPPQNLGFGFQRPTAMQFVGMVASSIARAEDEREPGEEG